MIGERVRHVREACQLTQEELARSSGVAQPTISQIEAGRILKPSTDVIERIAAATLYPATFFYLGPLPDMPEGRYRRMSRSSPKVSRQIRAQVRQIVELVQRAEPEIRLPAVAIDPIRATERVTDATIDQLAYSTRRLLGLGDRDPIPNVMRAVERGGVIVVRLPHGTPDHDGFSAWPDYGLEGRPVVAVTGSHPGDRDRFSVAHELGHLLLHTAREAQHPKLAESEAHLFAGAFLLPRSAAIELLRPPITLRVLMGVKAHFGVSMAMTARRAFQLELIDRQHYASLLKQLSARRWSRNEPIEVRPEEPQLIKKVVDRLAGSGSLRQRADRLSLPVFALAAIAA